MSLREACDLDLELVPREADGLDLDRVLRLDPDDFDPRPVSRFSRLSAIPGQPYRRPGDIAPLHRGRRCSGFN
jgi:hypothetical protein